MATGGATNRVTRALSAAGHPTITKADYDVLLQSLTEMLNRLPGARSAPVRLNDSSDTGIPGLFDAEVVRMRDPLPAEVVVAAEPADPASLSWTSAHDHVFVVARRMSTLREQHALVDDPGWPDDHPVVVAVIPVRDQFSQVERLRLAILNDPAVLAVLARSVVVLVCVAMACLIHTEWRAKWYDAVRESTEHVCLLDLPVADVVATWLECGVRLEMGLATGWLPQTSAIVFRTDEDGAPILLPATEAAIFGISASVEHASGHTVRLVDDCLTDVETATAAAVHDRLSIVDAFRSTHRLRGTGPRARR